MTLTLDLSPEQERRLTEAAQLRGLDAPAFALSLIDEGLQAGTEPEIVPQDDWERDIIDFPKTLPPVERHLTDEDLRRENIYQD